MGHEEWGGRKERGWMGWKMMNKVEDNWVQKEDGLGGEEQV